MTDSLIIVNILSSWEWDQKRWGFGRWWLLPS